MSAVVAGMEPWAGVVQLPTRSTASRGPTRNVVTPPCEDLDPVPSVPADVVLAEAERIQAHAGDIAETLRAVARDLPLTAEVLEHQLAALRGHAVRLGTLAAGASS